jgi:putative ABC transport system permease protein
MLLSASIKAATKTRATTVAIVTFVALGVAALTSAFNLADGALWRPPPLHEPERLVLVSSTHTNTRGETRIARWSYPRIQLIKQQAQSFVHVANYTPTTTTLTGGENPEVVTGEFVSPDYFKVMAIQPLLGRVFQASEDSVAGAHPVVVISYQFWQQHFGGRPGITGQTLSLGGHVLTMIGVLPEGFRGLSGNARVWMPTTMAPVLSYPEYLTTDQNFINIVARLKPDVSVARANVEFGVFGPQVFAALPVTDADSGEVSSAVVRGINELRATTGTRKSVLTLLAAVALLYLLACTNVTSLLLSKAAARRREMAIRQALGATSARLLPSVIAESALLVGVGGAFGLLLAFWVSALLPAPEQLWNTQNFNSALSAFADPAFGIRSAVFGLVLMVVTVVLVSWVPAAGLLRVNMPANLRDGARGFTVGGATLGRPNARGIIVAFEAALAMVLLLAGSLMIDSFSRMRATDLGIDASQVLTFDLRVPDAQVSPDDAPDFIRRVLAAITAVPGVVSASVDGGAPVSGSAISTLLVAGRPIPNDDDQPRVLRHYVAPDHFKTLGIPLKAGRTFTDQDDVNHPRVIIISELAAKRFWPNENPIGQRVWFGGGSSFNSPERSGEIIGVVGSVAYERLDREPFRPDFYTPYMQFTYASRMVFVRTEGDPLLAVNAVRAAVKTVSPDTPLRDVQSMESLIGKSWTRQRFDAFLFGVFAVLALLLSASGIYAVVSYAIHQRTREMGIRLALGATNAMVLRLVLREGMAFPLVGLGVGLVASLAMSRVLVSSLYQVSPTDPLIMFRTVAVLLLAAMAACAVPAWRATRVDPLVAMRAD